MFGYCLRWDLHFKVVSFIDYLNIHHHHRFTKRVCMNGLAIVSCLQDLFQIYSTITKHLRRHCRNLMIIIVIVNSMMMMVI